jgi:hypothetical protein
MSAKKEKVMDLSSSLSDIWKVLSDDERELLRKNARIANFKKNELIYCENEIPKDLMCLFKGKVKICRIFHLVCPIFALFVSIFLFMILPNRYQIHNK